MTLLTQFLLRLSFGLAAGMAITSSRQVTSGYFRNHLYVVLGLTSLAALLSRTAAPAAFWYAVGAAVASYVGAVSWLYEKQGLGKAMLLLVVLTSLAGAWTLVGNQPAQSPLQQQAFWARYPATAVDHAAKPGTDADGGAAQIPPMGRAVGGLRLFADISSGLLLGLTMASMLLGHWYLNTPTMQMAPLRRLLAAMAAAVVVQLVVSSLGLWGEATLATGFSSHWIALVVLRWTFGLLGVGVLVWMAWQTLKIPNTQSATGILYVAVIGTFVGETMALLLSTESLFPL